MGTDLIAAAASRRTLDAAVGGTVALLWVPLGLLHPHGEQMLAGDTTRWLMVHWGQLALTPVLGLVMLRLLRLPGTAAVVARAAVVVWVALLGALGASAAIATGLLVEGGFPEAATHLWDHVQAGAVLPVAVGAHLSWVVAAVAAAIALRANGAPTTAVAAMVGSALLMATGHGDVFSALGAVSLAGALVIAHRTPLGPPAG